MAPPGVSVPAATRGSSASTVASLLSEHARSWAALVGAGAEEVARRSCRARWSARPCRCRPRPSGSRRRRRASGTALAANTSSFVDAVEARVLLVPDDPRHGVGRAREGVVGLDRVAGRVDAQRRIAALPRMRRSSGSARSRPTCSQQKPLTLTSAVRACRRTASPAAGCLTARETKIWFVPARGAVELLPGHPGHRVVARDGRLPPATAGFSASRLVLMLSDGSEWPGARSWPDGSQTFAAAEKRLAKICFVAAEIRVGLVPADPGHRAPGAGEVDRRSLGLDRRVEVERRREALRHPRAALEGAHEDLLRRAASSARTRPTAPAGCRRRPCRPARRRRRRPGSGRCRSRGRC